MTAGFPEDWLITLTVTRGGYDPKGNPLPGSSRSVHGCLVGWRSTEDPVDRSDLVTNTAVAYANDPLADFKEGDRVLVPAGPWPSGEFRVDGAPKPWPMGLEIPLRRN